MSNERDIIDAPELASTTQSTGAAKRTVDGHFVERPPGAAPLFDPESGRKAALKRWEDKEARNREALVRFASIELDKEVTFEQALELIVLGPQFLQALKGKTAAAKIVLQVLGEMPEGADAKVLVDRRQVNFMNFRFNTSQARAYIDDQRAQGNESIASLVDSQMNWEVEENEIITVRVPLDDPD